MRNIAIRAVKAKKGGQWLVFLMLKVPSLLKIIVEAVQHCKSTKAGGKTATSALLDRAQNREFARPCEFKTMVSY
jgi:hypothetical protein